MCNRIKGIMLSEDFRKGFTTLVRVRCEMWSCQHCGPINAQRWRAYLLDRFNKVFRDEAWCFYTVTASKDAHRAGAIPTLKNLQRAWKRLYDRIVRRYGKGTQYVRVFEQHKSGRFHMHFLLNTGRAYDKHAFEIKSAIDEFRHPECKWLRRAMAQLGAGWRVHVRRVWEARTKTANVGLVVGYILKYMGKNMSIMEFPKHQHRIGTSRKIGSPDTSSKGQGTWTHMRDLPRSALKAARPIVDMTTGEILNEASFENEAYYPPLKYYNGGFDGN